MWCTLISTLLYLISILLISPILLKSQSAKIEHSIKLNKTLLFTTAVFAIIIHAINLSDLFTNLFIGQSFTLIEISSFISVIVAALVTIATFCRVKTLWFLLPIIYGFAIINQILQTLLPVHFIHYLNQNIGVLIHIGLALFAYAIFFITSLYAIQLFWIDRNLKRKQTSFSSVMPPLMTVEKHFFRLMLCGQLLLTLTLISGAVYLADFFAIQNIQKAALSFLAWIVFGISLFGHWKLYWRGKRMIIYTISGMILLTFAYFGSRIMLT
ncbi:ABC-type uncharacterized transport system permease subunit [Bisgaardia hudsonensis]|uniref:ABC-type uncharacterized transport system permease subunit n=1 Tax=Bisgaardia hudsonensis TaxID=109472 RepID=A0A4V2SJA7_9PAST|nr:cytochrome c biogenesis protein CcsA [Bisgaardia hudsonensis]QLB12472.1 ABC transporter permease [Bisgaardia hudsonensis]TCP14010.1 ABC-type uncharacterized transport system permease subunit [Bisgaardia hudsonensis]